MKNKSAHQLFSKKERSIEEYVELFTGRNTDEEEITTTTNDRYKRLYNLSKLNKEKAENYRQKIKEQRDLEELAECSFAPKINKDFKYKKVRLFNSKNYFSEKPKQKEKEREKGEEITDQIIQDLLKRQEEWVKKKNRKMEINKQIENNKAKEKLIFAPEINRNNQKIFDDMKIETQEIVADPESYKEYIDRNKKFIPNYGMNNSSNKEYNKTKNNLNNIKYDYTKHKLVNNSIISNISVNKNKYKNSKSVDSKRQIIRKSIPISKTKISNIKDEDIYAMVYFDSKEKYENRINEGFSEMEKKNIFKGKTQLEFKEALDILHETLINLDIIDDNDDDIDENYLAIKDEK